MNRIKRRKDNGFLQTTAGHGYHLFFEVLKYQPS